MSKLCISELYKRARGTNIKPFSGSLSTGNYTHFVGSVLYMGLLPLKLLFVNGVLWLKFVGIKILTIS